MKYLKYLILAIFVAYTALVPGKVSVDWLGRHVEVSVAIASACLASLVIIYWVIKGVIIRLFGFVRNLYAANKTEKVLNTITNTLIAIIRKDYKEGEKQILRFRKLMKVGHPILTWIEGCYRALVEDNENANLLFFGLSNDSKYGFLGTYSQYELRIKKSQNAAAFKIAQNYIDKNPRDFFFLEQARVLAIKEKQYDLALSYQERLPSRVVNQADEAVIHYLLSGSNENKITNLEHACKLDCSLVPAALEYAKCLVEADLVKKAEKYLWKCWEKSGHYRCVLDIFDILKAGEKEKLEIARRALELIPDRWDSYYVAGIAYFGAQSFVTAKEYFNEAGQVLLTKEIHDYAKLIKECNDNSNNSQSNDSSINNRSFEEPYWICSKCFMRSKKWVPICPKCESFNRLRWFSEVSVPAPHAKLTAATCI
ncbi:MAG: hypothetical protein LBI30_02775 [Holosporales bacterium]|jgi:uncharacterized membrane-anchored protein|nr:hypothetical protein [Holosporales bacterium]